MSERIYLNEKEVKERTNIREYEELKGYVEKFLGDVVVNTQNLELAMNKESNEQDKFHIDVKNILYNNNLIGVKMNTFVGDIVIVTDNSYCYKITNEGLEIGYPLDYRSKVHISDIYEVIAVNKKLPADDDALLQEKKIYNDTIIESDTGKCYMIRDEQLIRFKSQEYYDYLDRLGSPIDIEYRMNYFRDYFEGGELDGRV